MKQYPSKTRCNASVEEALKIFRGGDLSEACFIAGRIVGILDDGFVLQDESARIDLLYSGEAHVGDIVEVRVWAERRKDSQGKEVTVFLAKEFVILVPCLADFFIRKEDPNHVKMVIDRSMKETLTRREVLTKDLRDFFWEKGFTEVGTPEIVRLAGMEPYLDVFKTKFRGLPSESKPPVDEDMYLITSPEYAMKKLLVGGYEKIFQITKSFRNKEAESSLHNPEFTILEWYRAYGDYTDIMRDTEELVFALAQKVSQDGILTFGELEISTKPPWKRSAVSELFEEYAGIPAAVLEDPEELFQVVRGKGYNVTKTTPYEDLFFHVFMNEIEPKFGLKSPIIVYDYPVQMAALAKKCANEKYAQRFEVYMGGVELCNAFTELNDPEEQEQRLQQERLMRQKLGKDDYPVDRSFIRALQFGMPPSGGIALGVDRLMMLLTNTPDIRDILFFPHRDL